MKQSGTGIWSASLAFGDPGEIAEAAGELDSLGYTSAWFPGYGDGALNAAKRLLSATMMMTVGTGILNIWTYKPDETAAEAAQLQTASGGRFLLGLGVSHAPVVEALLNEPRYEKPLTAMTAFLEGLDSTAVPPDPAHRVLAALGPKMLQLASSHAGGAHPYNVTPEHTALARAILGPSKLLLPEQAVALTSSADEARQLGREFLSHYLSLPNYTNSLRRLGFTDADLDDGGSNRLIDALVAWGDEDAIATRVKEHRDAGADSVCVQVLTDGGMVAMPRQVWRDLAPALTAV